MKSCVSISLIFLFFFLLSRAGFAQPGQLDSLTNAVLHSKDDTTRAKNLIQLAFLYRDIDPIKGIEIVNEALRLSVKNDFYVGAAHSFAIEGVMHIRIGDYTEAVEKLNLALRIYEKLGDQTGMAGVYNNLGLVYNLQQNFDLAIDMYKKSLAIKFALMDNSNLATTLGNLGVIYAKKGEYDTAKWYVEQSLFYEKETDNAYGEAEAYQTLGSIAYLEADFTLAQNSYDRAIFIFDSIGSFAPKANCLVSIAEFQIESGAYADAIKNAEEALAIAEPVNHVSTIEYAYVALARAYEGIGDLESALKYASLLSLLRERTYQSDIAARTVEIQTKYESEKKEQENILLEKQNALLESNGENKNLWIAVGFTGAAFVASVFLIFMVRNKGIKKRKQIEFEKTTLEFEQKALRAQMNPHFIFNAINSIQSYILNKSEHEAYDYLAKFSRLIRIVLHNSQEKDLMLHQELDMIKLYVEMEQLRFSNRFEFRVSINDDVHPYEISVPAMLIQPYIENAIWHGLMNLDQERKGVLTLDLSMNDTLLKITVEDNGIGRAKSKLFKKEDSHKSIGMQLTEERLLMINKMEAFENAKVIITDLVNETGEALGTRVEIFIPVHVN